MTIYGIDVFSTIGRFKIRGHMHGQRLYTITSLYDTLFSLQNQCICSLLISSFTPSFPILLLLKIFDIITYALVYSQGTSAQPHTKRQYQSASSDV